MLASPSPPRRRCYHCYRPESLCLCAALPRVHTRTRIVIVQHPRERTHPFGSARLAGLVLPQARLALAHNGSFDGVLRCATEVPPDAAVLYPHPRAVDLADLPPSQRPSTLVVLDGTWAHARRLYADNPWLHDLPHVRLQPAEPSRYRIRKQPRADYVSTLEAIALALQILEPDTPGLDQLVAAFDHMIDQQVRLLDVVARHGRTKRDRERPSRRLPETLFDRDLVVAYAETAMPGGDRLAAREIVHWTAVRCADGAVFDLPIRPAGPWPADAHLAHMGLARGDLENGADAATAQARFRAFAGARAPVAAWSTTTLQWGAHLLGDRPSLSLKHALCNLRNRRVGYLEDVLRDEQLVTCDLAVRGRARLRLGNALAIAAWLRSRAEASVAATAAPTPDEPAPGLPPAGPS